MNKTISKRTVWIAAAFAALMVAVPAQAQVARFNVPFAFIFHEKTLPAGTYDVSTDAGNQTVALQCGGVAAGFALTLPVTRPANGAGSMVFHKYGSTYVLKTVWLGGVRAGYQLPAANAERELVRTHGRVEIASLQAR